MCGRQDLCAARGLSLRRRHALGRGAAASGARPQEQDLGVGRLPRLHGRSHPRLHARRGPRHRQVRRLEGLVADGDRILPHAADRRTLVDDNPRRQPLHLQGRGRVQRRRFGPPAGQVAREVRIDLGVGPSGDLDAQGPRVQRAGGVVERRDSAQALRADALHGDRQPDGQAQQLHQVLGRGGRRELVGLGGLSQRLRYGLPPQVRRVRRERDQDHLQVQGRSLLHRLFHRQRDSVEGLRAGPLSGEVARYAHQSPESPGVARPAQGQDRSEALRGHGRRPPRLHRLLSGHLSGEGDRGD